MLSYLILLKLFAVVQGESVPETHDYIDTDILDAITDSFASVEDSSILATLAKAKENVREFYADGLPSYEDPIWGMLAPAVIGQQLLKYAFAAIKSDATESEESLTSVEEVPIADQKAVAASPEDARKLFGLFGPAKVLGLDDPIWDILAPWALTPFLLKHGIKAIKGETARQLAASLTSVEEAPIVDRETMGKAIESVRKMYAGSSPREEDPIWDILASAAIVQHLITAIQDGDATEFAGSFANVEQVPTVNQDAVAASTENARQLYGGGLPSYQDPIWDILAPWALTPFLLKHGIMAIKGETARQLANPLASVRATDAIDEDKIIDGDRRLEYDIHHGVVRDFWQGIGNAWTCMYEDIGSFLLNGNCHHERRISEQSMRSIYV